MNYPLRFFKRASAIRYMSSSVPSLLKLFMAHKINLQLSLVYPISGIILSMLGERFFPLCPILFMGGLNGIPVISHTPVHLASAHSEDKSNGMPLFFALDSQLESMVAHG